VFPPKWSRRLFPPPDTLGAKLVVIALVFAGLRLIWDVFVGPNLVPYLPDRFAADADRARSAATVLALGYLAVVMPVLVLAGGVPFALVFRPVLRAIDAQPRHFAARVGQGFFVLLALIYYEIVWRYLAFPLAQAIGLVVTGLVLIGFVVLTLKDRRLMEGR